MGFCVGYIYQISLVLDTPYTKIRPFGHDLPPYAVHSFCNYLQFRQLLDITTNQPNGGFRLETFPLLPPLPTLKLQPATTITPIPFLKTRHPIRQPLTTYTGFFRFYRWEGVGRPRSCSSQKIRRQLNKNLVERHFMERVVTEYDGVLPLPILCIVTMAPSYYEREGAYALGRIVTRAEIFNIILDKTALALPWGVRVRRERFGQLGLNSMGAGDRRLVREFSFG